MTPPPAPPSRRARVRRDLRTAALAVVLLAACGALWLWMSSDARSRRENVLARVPAFPERGQPEGPRRVQVPAQPRPRPAPVAPPPEPRKPDAMTAFVLSPASTVALVNVNALLNTPLFARVRECLPARFSEAEEQMRKLGLDLDRDVDRVAMLGDGMAMSGFFEGKPVARTIAERWGQMEERTYRGQTVLEGPGSAAVQMGNLVLLGSRARIDALVDRVLDPPPSGADPGEVYGDIFVRSDLAALRGDSASRRGTSRESDAIAAVLQGLSGVTLRANVWDSVALSLEGKPASGASVAELGSMARGALSLARQQLDQDDVELSALAELAKVRDGKDGLLVDLALPAADLFDKLHFPCPGKEEPQQPRRFPGPNVPGAKAGGQ
jgi:hypothetical protein